MIFYKMKNEDKELFIKSEELFLRKDEIFRYAVRNNIVKADDEWNEAYIITSGDYIRHLLSKVYKAFSDELEDIMHGWVGKSPDEIYSICYKAVYINDIMNALDNADASDFDLEVLENWLKNPKDMVQVICDRIINRNCSDYNEAICAYISQGIED